MMPLDIKTLYSLVTEAIRKSEVLAELDAPGVRTACLDVSLLEERIASLLPPSNDEGAIARRGAVAAAIDAHEFTRAQELAARFLAEDGIDSALCVDLADLQAEASAMAARGDSSAETTVRGPVAHGVADSDGEVSMGLSPVFAGVLSDVLAGALRNTAVRELKKSGKFTVPSFGTFTVRKAKVRAARNPVTGEVLELKSDKTVRFEASPSLKKAV
jgi:DNA-binding protein HU-beta